ncbi:hypothetical protein SAMN05518672_102375 [Chitinophaga sp. CF118]|uniref:hypothetical protein n=1 Tax=Chitinophaga sp. CF118 TaxID=1884367 RepID=UPI0008DF2807|nr:hypothetical protein [Chitinophaga sp. CF118]SFD54594.1 hypothetical protein SAMN05518672_102375 [Chitinophaga sp. CF118]
MGYFVHLLKNWEKHSPLKMVKDIAEASFNIDALYHYRNDKKFFSDGSIRHFTTYIGNSIQNIDEDNGFTFEIEGLDPTFFALDFDKDFDYLVPGEKLCSLAYIDKLDKDAFELFYHFCYEYLKINTDEYIYLDSSTRPFSWEEMKKLSMYPYDKDWLLKDVI